MLVLSRKAGQSVLIGEEIKIQIVRIGPNTVRIGIDAPNELNIVREELIDVGDLADVIVLDRSGGGDSFYLPVGEAATEVDA